MEAAGEISGRKLGDFVVREQIGEGGFGIVHRAEQPLLGREAVIKLLHTRHRASPVLIQRFLREARLASRLDHPYAAHIYAFGVEPDGLMWIAMELVQGTPLNRLLKERGALPLVELVPLIERIAEVVHAAHEQGILHRDIKPGNVMVLARAGKLLPKLLDFGIAKMVVEAAPEVAIQPGGGERNEPTPVPGATDDTLDFAATAASPGRDDQPAVVLTQLGQLIGSPPYMAPELWEEVPGVDARADLYSLGVLTYEAVTGRRPFGGASLPALGVAHTLTPVPPVGDRFPAAVDDVFRKVLAKKPEERYPDAIAFAAALRSAAGLGTHAEELPRLDDALRSRLAIDAPQPIAEAMVELDAARNAHQARDALAALVSTIVRLIGLIAVACRARTGPGATPDSPQATDLVRTLRRSGLSDHQWLELAWRMTAPFVGRRELYPVPELLDLLADDRELFAEMLAVGLPTDSVVRGSEAHALEALQRGLPPLARLLEALAFLDRYPLVVGTQGTAELWMGVRRARRRTAAVASPPPDDQVWLGGASGELVVPLSPLVQVASPAPGAAREMFLLEGPGRQGARLTALPAGFDRYDDAPWAWLAERLLVGHPESALHVEERPPYRGLEAFTTADADRFVGRAREIEAVVNRLRTQALIAIVGPSGAGKSSLVQAGVIPAMPAGWRAITVRPGPAPLASLEAGLARAGIDPDALGAGEVLVLVIDQLEELFTQCHDVDERLRYTERLSRLARSVDDRVRVVLTLRDDFLVRAHELPPLRDRIAPGLLLLSTPAPDELEGLLVEPARRAGYDFDDPGLPRRIVAEVADLPGALALLSFTASRMWELRDRQFKRLSGQVYDSLGGVGGALSRHAETTLEALGVHHQRQVREVFRNLVTADGTRAALGRKQLAELLGSGAEVVIEKLIAARLLVASESEGGQERIEIVHESLLSSWPRLVAWRREDAEGARLRDQLRAAARQWVDRGRGRGLLWRDDALAEYRAWRHRWPARLTDDEEAFAQASVADAARARRLWRGAIAAALLLLGTAVIVLAWFGQRAQADRDQAVAARREEVKARRQIQAAVVAERERVTAQFVDQGRLALLQGDAGKALVWLHAARKRGSRDPVLPYMLGLARRPFDAQIRSFEGHTEPILALALGPDGRLALTASQDGTARLWEIASGRSVVLPAAGALTIAAFDPTGRRLFTAGAEGRIRVYDLGGRLLTTIDDGGGALYHADWSPDGERIAAARQTAEVWIWDASSGKLLHRLPQRAPVSKLAIGPDGTLACGTFGADLTLWNSVTGRKLASLTGHRETIRRITFSPDGRRVASTSLDGATNVWDLSTRRLAFPTLHGHNGWVERAVFSRDGRWLATASPDRTGRIWSMVDGSSHCLLEAHAGAVRSIAFDRTGGRVVTAGADGTAIVWDVANCAQVASLQGHAGPVVQALFDADDRVITAGWDGMAKQWRSVTGPLEALLVGHTAVVGVVGYSPDGSRIASYSDDGTIRLWSRDGTLLRAWAAHDGGVNGVAWTADGRRLASAGNDGQVAIWDPARGIPVHSMEHGGGGPPVQVAFSPDGERLVSASEDGRLRIWNPATGASEANVQAHDAEILVLRFSSDGARFVTADDVGIAKVWDPAGRLVRRLEVRGVIRDAAWSPDASLLAVASSDTRALIWDVGTGASKALHHGTSAQSIQFDHRGARVVTAADDGVVRIWDAHTGERLQLLEGHTSAVFEASFDPSDERIVTASNDATARVWDVRTGREFARLTGHNLGLRSARFDPTGRHVVTAGFDRAVMIWSLATPTGSISEFERLLHCAVPFQLREDDRHDRLESRRPVPADCAPE